MNHEQRRGSLPLVAPQAREQGATRGGRASRRRSGADRGSGGRSCGRRGRSRITPEEVAALPRIEDLTPDTDITAFLRRGVPEVRRTLRSAACGRSIGDPRLRERSPRICRRLERAGRRAGNGPLLPTDDVGAMLGRIFGDDDREPETAMPRVPAARRVVTSARAGVAAAPRRRRSRPCAADDAVQHETGSEQAAESAAAHLGRAPLEGAVEADYPRGRVVHRKKPTSLTPRARLGRAVMAEPRQFKSLKTTLVVGS